MIGLLWLDGGVALLDLARGLIAHGTPNLGLGLWALWIAPGLRRRHPRAHRAAIAYSWLSLATLGGLAAACSAGWVDPTRLDWRILGVPMAGPRPSYVAGLCLSSAALTGWQLHLLRRPDVRRLFAPVGSPLGAVTSRAG